MKHWNATSKDRQTFKSSRLVGVEWEYNHMGQRAYSVESGRLTVLAPWIKTWKGSVHEDGSCGYEAITPPIAGDHIARCLTDLGRVLSKHAKIDYLCSCHVHVNGGDLTFDDLYRLMWAYSKVEGVLFRLAGPARRNNIYCRPCGHRYQLALEHRFDGSSRFIDTQEEVLKAVYHEGMVNRSPQTSGKAYHLLYASRRGPGRYVALNLFPWLYAQKVGKRRTPPTLEFRLHKFTKDAKRIIGWCHLLVRLVDWAKEATDQQARELPRGVKGLYLMAPDSKKWILQRLSKKSKKGKKKP